MDVLRKFEELGIIDDFLAEDKAIRLVDRPYANSIIGCLELSHRLNEAGNLYLIIGGLAVACYVRQVNYEGFLKWRGTNDIDILVLNKDYGERALRNCGYEFRQLLKNKGGAIGPIYVYAREDNGETLVVGLRTGIKSVNKDITSYLLKNATKVDLWGVPINVPMIRDLVAMKRDANRPKDSRSHLSNV